MEYNILINKINHLNERYIPDNLVKVPFKYTNNKLVYLEKKTYHNLKKIIKIINKKFATKVEIISGFKTNLMQVQLFKDCFLQNGLKAYKMVEFPTHSEYQTGLAFDLKFININAYNYFLANAHNYGFILRYPKDKEKITGLNYQSNHFRFVGDEAALIIHKYNLSLEEYVEMFV